MYIYTSVADLYQFNLINCLEDTVNIHEFLYNFISISLCNEKIMVNQLSQKTQLNLTLNVIKIKELN